jgi:hypothetical protein
MQPGCRNARGKAFAGFFLRFGIGKAAKTGHGRDSTGPGVGEISGVTAQVAYQEKRFPSGGNRA